MTLMVGGVIPYVVAHTIRRGTGSAHHAGPWGRHQPAQRAGDPWAGGWNGWCQACQQSGDCGR